MGEDWEIHMLIFWISCMNHPGFLEAKLEENIRR